MVETINGTTGAVQTQETHTNSLTYEDQVVKKIAGIATSEISGILSMSGGFISDLTDKFRSNGDITKGIDAEVGEKQVALDLKVICEYGKNIPEIFQQTISKVKKQIKDMTGLDVVEINMHVDDVMTRKEFDANNNSKAEEKTPAKPVNNDRVQ
ncbi:Asp23/Gls24 family envelope stress response protein [Carnobacterium gallinarum]|uniref:Asp23/Gls24 family envelope stress response protein n=1 Tax=Carnobacterium gallinarum TaxID=2749 RepID=UPI00054FC476|nr:Asp23/Gls24 family envelope stress response protein [Carnobacterium gallinarum]